MPRPDNDAAAGLDLSLNRPVLFGYFDFLGGAVRVTNAPYSVAFSGTGDEELDGHTFDAVDHRMVALSDITYRDGGMDTVTATLSNLPLIDIDLENELGDPANWRGRTARIWEAVYSPSLTRLGMPWGIMTGYMTNVRHAMDPGGEGAPGSQTVIVSIEHYLAMATQPSNRSYLAQELYDPNDRSAEAAIAIANGTSGNGLIGASRPGQSFREQWG